MLRTIALAAVCGAVAAGAYAATHEVEMLNMGADGMMVFEPAFIQVEPGDTVTFIPTDKSHNAESIEGMLPDDAAPIVGEMNEEISVTFEKEGVYGVKCNPHYAMGMVALVQVGEPANLEAARAVEHRGLAAERMEGILAQVE